MTTPKYKVGQRVRIRSDLENRSYGPYYFLLEMFQYLGKILTIKKIGTNYFFLEEAFHSIGGRRKYNVYHSFTTEMFDPTFVDELNHQYKNPTCKGSWVLGSACGSCERCEEEKHEETKLKEEKPTPTLPFQVGDICKAFGLECVVKEISKVKDYPVSYPVTAKFRNIEETYSYFTLDGKRETWHKTPSLNLIRRPKPVSVETPVKVEENKEVVWEYQYTYFLEEMSLWDTTATFYKDKKELKDGGELTETRFKSAKRLARSKKIRGGG